jgi:nucleoside-diphosphate-sugar epimerase
MTVGKKIFITGSTGFIGRHLIEDSVKLTINYFALTRKASTALFPSENVTLLKGDINDIAQFYTQISECDYFIHMAGEKRDISKMESVNVEGMRKVLDVVVKAPSLKFMYVSSGGVYGIRNNPELVLSEGKACYPSNAYEKSKLDAEKLLIKYAEEYPLKFVILRPSDVIGEGDKQNKLLNLMRQLKKGRFFFIDRSAVVNYVYVKYVTASILEIIRQDKFDNEICNVNSPMDIHSFVEVLKAELDVKKNFASLPKGLTFALARFLSVMPRKFQVINPEKYDELVNHKFYSIEKLRQVVPIDGMDMLRAGLRNLTDSYRKQELL